MATRTTLPRVVGLMPTCNRPDMAHRAMHLFLDQEYGGEMHLLVFDDGDQRVTGCPACLSQVELVVTPRMKLPTKRNAMMEHVGDRDAFYFMWDDDDYHGSNRVDRQVDALVSHEACLLRPTLYYNAISGELRTSTWISDATIAYHWDFWNRRRFFDGVDPGSGYHFVANRPDVAELHGELDYMTVVHAGQRHTPPAFGPPDFYEAPVPSSWAQERLRLP